MRDCLIVVGMHRSGTSALAGAVHRLGVSVGSDIVKPQDDNIRGYYEHRGVLELHEGLLAACGSAWDDIAPPVWRADDSRPPIQEFQQALRELLRTDFADSPVAVVKDPRLCHLLPLWLPVLADLGARPRVLIAYRPAAEVAGSLARRNGFSADKSNFLWAHHVIAAELASRDCPRGFVEFSRLLTDPVGVLERVARQLEIEWPQSPADREESLREFVDPSLRHLRADPAASAPEVILELEAALAAATQNPRDLAAFEAVAGANAESEASNTLVMEHLHQFARREATTSVWTAKEELSREILAVSQRLGQGLANLEHSLSDLQSSRSELADELAERARMTEGLRMETDRTLRHLSEVAAVLEETTRHQSEVAAVLEEATRHQSTQLADLGARLDRLQYVVDVEGRLQSLRADLEHVASLTRNVGRLARKLDDQQSRWQHMIDRLAFWRSRRRAGTSPDA